jgi:glycosyltransferase involved in cell wall biosynthesis
MIIDVIIPAYNEENAIGKVIQDIPKHLVRDIIVCDNNSTDQTSAVATAAGATALFEPQKGYGNACLKGMAHIAQKESPPDLVLFLDGDYSDYPQELQVLLDTLIREDADMILGSRALGQRDKKSMTPQQVFGNWLATRLIRLFYGYRFTDLGPFRLIKYPKLLALQMQDRNFGWTVEMQVKAARQKMKCLEVPVTYRERIGVSKVSGTVKGTIGAGYKILYTIFKYMR